VSLAPTYPSDVHRFTIITIDILFCVSLAHCLLVPDFPLGTDVPYAYRLSETCFLSDRRPHHLIIIFPSCTLRVHLLPDVFLSRTSLRLPLSLKPSFDARSTKRF
jgi:hypothetical protein